MYGKVYSWAGTTTKPLKGVYLGNKNSLHSKISSLPVELKWTPNKSISDIKFKIWTEELGKP